MAMIRVTVVLFLGLISCVPLGWAIVEDLVLDVYPYVQVNEIARYSCRSSKAAFGDPVFVWTIRNINDRLDILADNLQEVAYSNKDSPNDGIAESTVEFVVQQRFIGQNLWCSARESNQPASVDVTTLPGIPAQIALGVPAPRGNLGQQCNTDGSCNSNLFTCTQVDTRTECQCISGYTQSGSNCVAKVELGQLCDSNNFCRPDNSFCNAGTCACNTGYIPSGGECYVQFVPLDQSCVIAGQTCSATFSVCSATSRTCVCDTSYYRIVLNGVTSCRQKGTINGGSCTVGLDSCLPANSECVSPGVCTCIGQYVWNGNQCAFPSNVNLGDSCDDQTTICSVQFSVCGTTFPRLCECSPNYYQFSNVECRQKSSLGGVCAVNYDSCFTPNAVCTNSLCECGSGYVRQGSNCVQRTTAGLGEFCNNSTVVCSVADSVCGSRSTCECKSGYYVFNSICTTGGGIGALCLTTQPGSCLTVNAECRSDGAQDRCSCIQGYEYIPSAGTCDLPSLGNFCVDSIGCKRTATGNTMTNPVCTVDTCSCPSSYYGLNGQCIIAGGIGDKCSLNLVSCITTNAECSPATTPPTCACKDGYVHSSNTGSCDVPALGQPCTDNVGCQATALDATMSNPQCIRGTCSCSSSSYYSYDGKCIQKHALGQTCYAAVSEACSDTLAECRSSGTAVTCQCRSAYTNTNGVCTGESGEFCGPPREANTTGVSFPESLRTPDVRVNSTCYEIPLFQSGTMACEDTKKSSALQHGRWEKKLVNGQWIDVGQQTETYINGDAAHPSVTVSNAQPSYAGDYRCVLCYGTGQTRCTTSETVKLYVTGTALASVTTSMSPTTPKKGDSVTLTCTTSPADVATSYRWFRNGQEVIPTITTDVYTINNVQPSSDGSYYCEASNTYGTVTSSASPIALSVQYAPTGPRIGETQDVFGDLASSPIRIQCVVDANPAVQTYYFFDSNNNLVQGDSRRSLDIDNDQGYGTYSCEAENEVDRSQKQYFNVQPTSTPGVGAATEDSGLSTGTIVAIVLGIIFLLLLILIIIVCCCSYGWCRKKEKVQPEVIQQPVAAKPYVIRPVMSAASTVSRRDVGVLVKGHDFPNDQDRWPYKTEHYYSLPTNRKHFIEPEERYTPSPRYYLKPATNGGPIISMYDDKYSQPRPLQLPALDTQYLYVDDDEPKRRRHRRKKHRHERRDKSPRQSYYEPDPDQEDVENKYAEVLDARSDDLVVVPGKQNYFE